MASRFPARKGQPGRREPQEHKETRGQLARWVRWGLRGGTEEKAKMAWWGLLGLRVQRGLKASKGQRGVVAAAWGRRVWTAYQANQGSLGSLARQPLPRVSGRYASTM